MAARNPVPSLQELEKYNVNRAGEFEAVRQSLYDFQTYAQAGQTQLIFFQVPAGQSSKTNADTNLEIAGSLPNPKMHLVQSIEVLFYPSVAPSRGPIADESSIFLNDVYNVSKSGWLSFFIGSKEYLKEAPIGRFPPKTKLDGFAAIATSLTAGAATQSRDTYAVFSGRPYLVDPWILLKPTQNFNVTLNWPTAVALNAADTAARIGVALDGVLYRNSQ